MDFDFDTAGLGGTRRAPRTIFGNQGGGGRSAEEGDFDRSLASWWLWLWGGNPNSGPGLDERSARGDYVIPGGSRKAILVHLAVAAWRSGSYVPRDVFPRVRGHELDPEVSGAEDKLVRALTRTSMGEIEQVLGPIVRGKLVVVQGLSFVRELVAPLYAGGGRPSIDPVVFFELQLVVFFEDLRSERQLMRVVADRLSLRWYLGYVAHPVGLPTVEGALPPRLLRSSFW